ncbi:hypothetical protein [Haloplanus pelagicus]|uniref:hypothetical protein n=1 Tax=Haloplanus pelagicus TaxID=2949995 RepID=UPI00203E45BA|nr:hypothetical protein [Haloplanus sp. HW8-1]
MTDDLPTGTDETDGTESGADDRTADGPTPDTDHGAVGGLSKRTLIRLLVGFGIGIPILVEGLTFLGLLRNQFGGGGGGSSGEDTATATVGSDAVAVGDDMLPETDRAETLASAVLREIDGDRWPLSLTVDVRNTGDTDYEFQLLGVHLDDGRTVSGRTSTDRLAPSESRTITAERSIPAGSTPRAVEVVALLYGGGSVETVERRVELAKIPVRGG